MAFSEAFGQHFDVKNGGMSEATSLLGLPRFTINECLAEALMSSLSSRFHHIAIKYFVAEAHCS